MLTKPLMNRSVSLRTFCSMATVSARERLSDY
jgi:hypothetical protein